MRALLSACLCQLVEPVGSIEHRRRELARLLSRIGDTADVHRRTFEAAIINTAIIRK